MPTIAVEPIDARNVEAACPKLMPSSEIPAYWLHIILGGPTPDMVGASNENTLVNVPSVTPAVTTTPRLLFLPPGDLQDTDVSDFHIVNSLVVTPTPVPNEIPTIPKLIPAIVKLIDPVAAILLLNTLAEP